MMKTILDTKSESDEINSSMMYESAEEELKDQGLFQGEDRFLLINDDPPIHSSGYYLKEIDDFDDLLETASYLWCDDNRESYFKITQDGNKPYFHLVAGSSYFCNEAEYTVVPMQWMEEALKSDIKDDIEDAMYADDDIRDGIRESIPELTEGMEAVTGIKDYLLCYYDPKNDKRDPSIDKLAENLSMLDLNKLKALINDKYEDSLYATAEDWANEAGSALGLSAEEDNGRTVKAMRIGNAKRDEKLVAGIKEVLTKGQPHDVSRMVSNLFSRQRVNEVYKLQHLGEKSMAR